MTQNSSRPAKFFAATLLLTLSCNAAFANAQAFLQRAKQYHMARRYAAALEWYNQAISADPKLVDAYYGRAASYVDAGMESKALPDCDKVIAMAPKKYPEIYRFRALADAQMEQPAKTVEDCNKAMALGIKDQRIFFTRAEAYRELGQYQKALADFNTVMDLYKAAGRQKQISITDLHDERGELYEALGQPDKALADWRESMTSDPKHEMAYQQSARLYDRLGKQDKAVETYTTFLKFYPEDSQAWAERGRFYAKMKKYPEAIKDLSKAIDLEPVSYPKLYQARAEVYAKMGRADMAAKDKRVFDDMQR